MDGSIDIRLIVTLAGMLFSVAGAAAVAKMQLKIINEQLKDIESRLRVMDKRVDHTELTWPDRDWETISLISIDPSMG